jgi:hypothetical protein
MRVESLVFVQGDQVRQKVRRATVDEQVAVDILEVLEGALEL